MDFYTFTIFYKLSGLISVKFTFLGSVPVSVQKIKLIITEIKTLNQLIDNAHISL